MSLTRPMPDQYFNRQRQLVASLEYDRKREETVVISLGEDVIVLDVKLSILRDANNRFLYNINF